MGSSEVAVWEYMNGYYASWCTFEPFQCNIIEKAYQAFLHSRNQQNTSVVSGHDHSVNFITMEETNTSTGEMHPVRRLVFSLNSALGNSVSWQWNVNVGKKRLWQSYPADVVAYIEEIFQNKSLPSVDLSKKFFDLEYTIDFSTDMQINNHTKYQRPIQRIILTDKYPVVASHNSLPSTSKAATASVPTASYRLRNSQKAQGDGGTSTATVPKSLKNFANACSNPPSDSCSICLVPLDEDSDFADLQSGSSAKHTSVVELNKCNHSFHTDCLLASLKNNSAKCSLTCPTCKRIYGVKKGTQPAGSMTHSVCNSSLPGYQGYKTIVITYNFRSGTQGSEHPNPGQRYYAHSFPRTAYLPDTQEGRKVLALLKIAFDRRLTFTIGRSVTTGADNTITWNEIHHKTEMVGNHSGHGFPDPNYFRNVVEELKQQGVTEDDLNT